MFLGQTECFPVIVLFCHWKSVVQETSVVLYCQQQHILFIEIRILVDVAVMLVSEIQSIATRIGPMMKHLLWHITTKNTQEQIILAQNTYCVPPSSSCVKLGYLSLIIVNHGLCSPKKNNDPMERRIGWSNILWQVVYLLRNKAKIV